MSLINASSRLLFIFFLAALPVLGADPEAGEVFAQSMTLAEIIGTGGWIMYVLGVMSVGGVALIVYFFIVLREEQVTPKVFTLEVSRLLAEGKLADVRTACAGKPSPVSAVTLAALDYADHTERPDPGMVKEIIEGEGSRQSAMIQNQTHYLLDIGVIAPMIGLLGTVLGMLTAFNAVALDLARARPIYLAQGVSQALVTTAAGLMVGIPAMIFYAYFRGRTGKLIARLETVSADLLTQLLKSKKK